MKYLLPFFLCFTLLGCAQEQTRITILHTNDVQGYFDSRQSNDDKKQLVGGLSVLKKMVAKQENNFLLFDSGNIFSGTREGILAKFEGSFALLKELPYTAVTLSAADFSFGWNDVENGLKNTTFPIVISNLKRVDGSQPDSIKESFIFTFNGVKIGVLGVLSKADFNKLPRQTGLVAEDEIESLKPLILKLEEQNCTIIILISSLGLEREDKNTDDKTLAEELQGINIIFGGGGESSSYGYDEISKVILARNPASLRQVGEMSLAINKNGQISSYDKKTLLLDSSVYGEDSSLKEKITILYNNATQKETRRITVLEETLSNEGLNSSLGQYIATCIRTWGQKDIGLINADAITSALHSGEVTEENLYKTFPFDDKVMFLKMRGDDLRIALETTLNSKEDKISVSGLKIFYEEKNQDKKITKIIFNGQEIKDDTLYSIALPDHIISAGIGHNNFLNMYEFKNTDREVRDIIKWCLYRKRINLKQEDSWQRK